MASMSVSTDAGVNPILISSNCGGFGGETLTWVSERMLVKAINGLNKLSQWFGLVSLGENNLWTSLVLTMRAMRLASRQSRLGAIWRATVLFETPNQFRHDCWPGGRAVTSSVFK